MEKVIEALLAAGYVENGRTPTETVRWATRRAPVYGRGACCGGELRTLGGRLRYQKGERRVTVGQRTVCFYRVVGGKATDFETVPTKDVEAVRQKAGA